MVKTIIMTSVRAIGPGAGPSMLNIGAADIVRGHMVVHDLGAGSECVGGPLAAALSRFQFWAHLDDRLASSRLRARYERPGQRVGATATLHPGNRDWPASAERRNLAADKVEVAHPIEVGVVGDTGCAVAGAALGSAP
jgi:hypothetical protein